MFQVVYEEPGNTPQAVSLPVDTSPVLFCLFFFFSTWLVCVEIRAASVAGCEMDPAPSVPDLILEQRSRSASPRRCLCFPKDTQETNPQQSHTSLLLDR